MSIIICGYCNFKILFSEKKQILAMHNDLFVQKNE